MGFEIQRFILFDIIHENLKVLKEKCDPEKERKLPLAIRSELILRNTRGGTQGEAFCAVGRKISYHSDEQHKIFFKPIIY